MFEHPFFDPSTLSDDEIVQKMASLTQRLMVAQWTSHNMAMRGQIQGMIEALTEERERRLQIQTQEAWDKQFPERIESDPEFKLTRGDKADEKASVVKPVNAQKKFGNEQIFHKEYSKSGAEKKKQDED